MWACTQEGFDLFFFIKTNNYNQLTTKNRLKHTDFGDNDTFTRDERRSSSFLLSVITHNKTQRVAITYNATDVNQ